MYDFWHPFVYIRPLSSAHRVNNRELLALAYLQKGILPLLVSLIVVSCGKVEEGVPPTLDNSAIVEQIYVSETVDSNWLHDGPIYETHPYYHGGTFNDVVNAIPEIANLGVKTIYIMPIWQQPPESTDAIETHSRNIYRIYDYYEIDPVYGTPEDLKRVVQTAHEYSMKVIFDLVMSNTPMHSAIWQNGWIHQINLQELEPMAEQAEAKLSYRDRPDGKYITFGCVERDSQALCELAGQVQGENILLLHFPRAGWGFAPDYTNPELMDYFAGVASHYVQEYDIDGWRIDAPGNNWNPRIISGDHDILPMLQKIRQEITQIKPDAQLICETVGVERGEDPPPILEHVCDATYSQDFYTELLEEQTSDHNVINLLQTLKVEDENSQTNHIRFIESHDTPRVAQLYPRLDVEIPVLFMTTPGIVMLQAGQEIGSPTRYGPDLPVDWSRGDEQLRSLYRKLIQLRETYQSLKFGSLDSIPTFGDNIFAYKRSYQAEQAIILINFGLGPADTILNLSVPPSTILKDVLNDEVFEIDDPNNITISVPGRSARILLIN